MKNFKLFMILFLFFLNTEHVRAIEVNSELTITYKSIEDAVARLLYDYSPGYFSSSCENGADNKGQSYRCGELPYGNVVTDANGRQNKKWVFKIEPQYINQSGTTGFLPSTPAFVTIPREGGQIRGVKMSEKLISSPDTNLYTSSKLGDDIYMRLFPSHNDLYGIACAYVPGVKFTIPTLYGAVKHGCVTANIKVDFSSQLGFNSIKTCFAFKIKQNTTNFKEKGFELVPIAIQKPQVQGVTLFKINSPAVDAQEHGFFCWFVNLFTDITGEFSGKVSKGVQKALTDQLGEINSKLSDQELFAKYLNEIVNVPLKKIISTNKNIPIVDNLWDKLQNDIDHNNSNPILNSASIVNQCKNDLPVSLRANCEILKDIQIRTFQGDAKSRENSCYSHWMRITSANPSTAPRSQKIFECVVKHKLSINVPPAFENLAQCYLDNWKHGFNDDCRRFLSSDLASSGVH